MAMAYRRHTASDKTVNKLARFLLGVHRYQIGSMEVADVMRDRPSLTITITHLTPEQLQEAFAAGREWES